MIMAGLLCAPLSFAEETHPVSLKKAWKSQGNNVMVMAHRGNHKKAPENSLIAYDDAIAAGADFVEVDVRLTRDNRWVVHHDRMIYTRNGTRKVLSSMTYEQLQKQRIKGARHGMPDQAIPTLHEILEALRGRVLIYLDDKMGRPLDLAEIVRQHEMEDQVVIGINDYADAIIMSAFAKDIAWRARVRPLKNEIEKYLRLKPTIIEVNNVFALTDARIDQIHKAGARIMVNCTGRHDSNEYYSIMVEKVGADIIQTDNLEKLLAFLHQLDAA